MALGISTSYNTEAASGQNVCIRRSGTICPQKHTPLSLPAVQLLSAPRRAHPHRALPLLLMIPVEHLIPLPHFPLLPLFLGCSDQSSHTLCPLPEHSDTAPQQMLLDGSTHFSSHLGKCCQPSIPHKLQLDSASSMKITIFYFILCSV